MGKQIVFELYTLLSLKQSNLEVHLTVWLQWEFSFLIQGAQPLPHWA